MNEDMQSAPLDETQMPSEAPEATPEDKKISDIVRSRLKTANQARTEAEARAARAEADLQAFQQKHEMMHQVNQKQSSEAPGMIPVSEVEKIVQASNQKAQQEQQQYALMQKIGAAAQEDPELAQLLRNGNDLNPIKPLLGRLGYIPNMPAVVKHLLKDPADYAELEFSTPQQMVAKINSLSKSLAGLEPKASGFKESPKLSESETDGEISAVDYIYNRGSKKY